MINSALPIVNNMRFMTICALLASFLVIANAHSFHQDSCPNVEPVQEFQIDKFLGNWFVIEKTLTARKCISYNYSRGKVPGKYLITQDSNHRLGVKPLKYKHKYTGELTVLEPSKPARMKVRFPLGESPDIASHVVFSTDYDNYAAIFTCQTWGTAHFQSITILSRRRKLDQSIINNIRRMLTNFGVDHFALSTVPQMGCEDTMDESSTFSYENVENFMSKAHSKTINGIEWVSHSERKVYYKIAGAGNLNVVETNVDEWMP